MKGWEKIVGPVRQCILNLGGKILQEKEKFGEWRCYYSLPEGIEADLARVIRMAVDHATELSRGFCIDCGAVARYKNKGWILPLCEKHIEPNREYILTEPRVITKMYEVESEV